MAMVTMVTLQGNRNGHANYGYRVMAVSCMLLYRAMGMAVPTVLTAIPPV